MSAMKAMPAEADGVEASTVGVLSRRIVAWAIDGVLVGALCLTLWCVLFVLGIVTFGLGFFLLNGLWVVPIAYTVLFIASSMAGTPGMAMLRLRLIRAEDGLRPNAAQALVYALGYWLTMATAGLLLLIAFFTEGNRTLHDIVAGVVMVRCGRRLEGPMAGGAAGPWPG